VQAEEGQLARVSEQVMLQPDGNFEDGLAFGADTIFAATRFVKLMAEVVKHDFVSPSKLSVTDLAYQFTIAWSAIPVHSTYNTVTWLKKAKQYKYSLIPLILFKVVEEKNII